MKFPRFNYLVISAALSLAACTVTNHPTQMAGLGKSVGSAKMEAQIERAGIITLQTIHSADWEVPLSGLLNLKHPKAVAAGLQEREEKIQIYTHLIHHPQFGDFLVDTGVSEKLLTNPELSGLSWLMRKGMHLDKMRLNQGTANILKQLQQPLSGVFFTHLHLDHISALTDIDATTKLYAGPSETLEKSWLNLFVRSSTDQLFANKAALRTWQFSPDPQQQFAGIIDIFGDGSAFAISVPGHTAGSTAYLIRSTQGPVLLTGDTSHTRWGWDNEVEPGDYTRDGENNRKSLQKLKALVARHPSIEVRLGHQK